MREFRLAAGLVSSLGLIGFMLACQQPAPDTRAADEQAIANTGNVQMLNAAKAKDPDGVIGVYTSDGVALPPNAPVATSSEAVRAVWSQMFENPGYAVDWKTTKIEVARSGDLAYSMGTYQLTLNDATGKPVTDQGKWVAIWKKQADGSWKLATNIWNSNQPPPASAKR